MNAILSILLVEDEALIAMDLRANLEESGYRCRVVASGEKAVEASEREAFDLVVMDNHLAGAMSGIDAARAIRARRPVPIVFMTGYPMDEPLRERLRPFQPAVCLEKPVDVAILLKSLADALS